MAKSYTVLFAPDQVSVEVPAGTTILSSAVKAGIYLNSLCGGDGVCGRCRVVVKLGDIRGGSTEKLTFDEIRKGYVLACQARVHSDLVVEVPPETRVQGKPTYVESDTQLLTDAQELGRRRLKLSPLVQKHFLRLPEPSLEDNLSDLQRLEHALKRATGLEEFQMGLKVTRRLPELFRQNDWQVTAVTGRRGRLTEIIDVEGGDTTPLNMGIAADIGTTTLVCHLVDLRLGRQTLGVAARYNSQASFGGDVIRRIIYASGEADGAERLQETVVNDLNELIHELVTAHRLAHQDISVISVAGNTTMVHLLLGLPTEWIRKQPYVGAGYGLPPFRAAEVGLNINPRGLLYCLPCVAGFVGADVVADVLATGMGSDEHIRMLIDIGTNGEIVIGNSDFLVCASASAGTAFEGADCRDGMRAARGAIDHIRFLNARRVMSYSTVGSAAPKGICGTGYVDLLAEMLRVGVIDKTGRLNPDVAPERFRQGEADQMEYVVIFANEGGGGKDIVIAQGDISNLLRAKGAIYAASCVLLNALSLSFDQIEEFLVAGAFGNFLNTKEAVTIGLLPDVPRERVRFIGNGSIAGAKLAAVCHECYEEAHELAKRMTYFELSTDPTFMDQFVAACFFPHTDIERFPSVLAELGA